MAIESFKVIYNLLNIKGRYQTDICLFSAYFMSVMALFLIFCTGIILNLHSGGRRIFDQDAIGRGGIHRDRAVDKLK